MHVFHIVLDDDEIENVKRWAEECNVTPEKWVQSQVDEAMEAQLDLERGKE